MKLPFIDIHIVKGSYVLTDEDLINLADEMKEQKAKNKLRNKMVEKLLDKIEHLKEQLRQK